ncbi:hypothetical protein K1719_020599 [Acacia pycnantha]|nr:hypothetical protein K1719_020599 [Acacia pycnantha]
MERSEESAVNVGHMSENDIRTETQDVWRVVQKPRREERDKMVYSAPLMVVHDLEGVVVFVLCEWLEGEKRSNEEEETKQDSEYGGRSQCIGLWLTGTEEREKNDGGGIKGGEKQRGSEVNNVALNVDESKMDDIQVLDSNEVRKGGLLDKEILEVEEYNSTPHDPGHAISSSPMYSGRWQLVIGTRRFFV